MLVLQKLIIAITLLGLASCSPRHSKFDETDLSKEFTNAVKPHQAGMNKTALSSSLGMQNNRFIHFPGPDKQYLMRRLNQYNIQFIQYRDTITLIVPTDQYFLFNSDRLNDLCFDGLDYIVELIKLYPGTTVYISAFSDNVGERQMRNELTQARAEAMLTFMWSHNISSKKLRSAGFGDRYPIADHATIRGSAMNRRLEIQWTTSPDETLDNTLTAMK